MNEKSVGALSLKSSLLRPTHAGALDASCRAVIAFDVDTHIPSATPARAISTMLTHGVSACVPRVTHTRRGAPKRTSVIRSASERRAQSGDEADKAKVDAEAKLMGRRGTFREATEDDLETSKAKSSVQLNGAFGKPSAPKETWEPFQRAARAGLLDALMGGKDGQQKSASEVDLVVTAMCVAVEDDAFKSRTAVCLPTEAYTKRVDKLISEFMQRDYVKLQKEEGSDVPNPKEVIEALGTFFTP